MLPIYVALDCETDSISPREFTRVAAALDKQVTRDFGPIWGVPATVDPVFSLDDIPVGIGPSSWSKTSTSRAVSATTRITMVNLTHWLLSPIVGP